MSYGFAILVFDSFDKGTSWPVTIRWFMNDIECHRYKRLGVFDINHDKFLN